MIDNKELEKFNEINKIIRTDGIVFVGADYFADLPLNELASAFRLDESIHNRSVKGIHISEVITHIDKLIIDLHPSKIFLNLGESETKEGMDIKEIIDAYEWLLYTIHGKSDAEIFVISLGAKGKLHAEFNSELENLCKEAGCRFIDISVLLSQRTPDVEVFNALKLYVRNTLDFTELMLMR